MASGRRRGNLERHGPGMAVGRRFHAGLPVQVVSADGRVLRDFSEKVLP
jgi:hypothetical protein